MSFNEVISGADLSVYIEKFSTHYPDQPVPTKERVLQEWELDYAILGQLWDIRKDAPSDSEEFKRFSQRARSVLYGLHDVRDVTSSYPINWQRGSSINLDMFLTVFITAQEFRGQTLLNRKNKIYPVLAAYYLANILIDNPDISLDDAISSFRVNDEDLSKALMLNLLFSNVGSTDPQSPTVEITRLEDSPYDFLHIGRHEINPFKQTRRVLKDLQQLRMQLPPGIPKPVRGISWLINTKTLPFLGRAGFKEESSIETAYFDPNPFLSDGEIIAPNVSDVELQELFLVSLACISHSPENVRKFVLEGKIPQVGIVTIPPEVFYRHTDQLVIE